jgi:GxxExxY protein
MNKEDRVTDGSPMRTDEKRFDWITEKIIGCAFLVANALGYGFLEKVYENALAHELRKIGLRVEQQVRLTVRYDGVVVGEYVADLVVEGVVIVEIKADKGIEDLHMAQTGNYLAATQMPVGLVINFGQKVTVRRVAGPALMNPSV